MFGLASNLMLHVRASLLISHTPLLTPPMSTRRFSIRLGGFRSRVLAGWVGFQWAQAVSLPPSAHLHTLLVVVARLPVAGATPETTLLYRR